MRERILVVGCNGNMGRRYRAILNMLGCHSFGIDITSSAIDYLEIDCKLDGIIIATPTETHVSLIKYYWKKHKVPILCEKPIAFTIEDIDSIYEECPDIQLRMINQYDFVLIDYYDQVSHTLYNYYHSGKDGKFWDCINIIGKSDNTEVDIRNDSPVWWCVIDGAIILKSSMDDAYILNVRNWLTGDKENKEYIYHAHKKVIELCKTSK